MGDSAVVFQAGFAVVLTELEKRRLIRLRPNQNVVDAARLLTDGARGVTQALPHFPASTLPERYRRMCEALMYGFAELPARSGHHVPPRRDITMDMAPDQRPTDAGHPSARHADADEPE